MKMKTVMIALAAFAMGGAANAITSEERQKTRRSQQPVYT